MKQLTYLISLSCISVTLSPAFAENALPRGTADRHAQAGGGVGVLQQLASDQPDERRVYSLSPFEVTTSADVGYEARETLAGTRLSTSLKDVAGQVTVMTKEFLQDLAITDLNDALQYSLNTLSDSAIFEVTAAGVAGAYAYESPLGGVGPTTGGRMRGIGPPNRGHDFFDSVVPIDTYNTDRFDFASGPNSILFGNGQPSGTINATFKRAGLQRSKHFAEVRIDDLGSRRMVLDLDQPIKKEVLGVRIAALRNRGEGWRKPSFDRSDRLYASATFKPVTQLSVRAYFERGNFHSQTAMDSLVTDHLTPWLVAGRPVAMATGTRDPVFASYSAPGGGARFYYNFDQIRMAPAYVDLKIAPVPNPAPAKLPFAVVRGHDQLLGVPDAYRFEHSIMDESIYPYDINFQGNVNQAKNRTMITGLIAEVNPLRSLFVEVAYNRETYRQRAVRGITFGSADLYVDANQFLRDGSTPNPYFGKYYFQTGDVYAARTLASRDQRRLSISYELDFQDSPDWRRWLGRHRAALLFDRRDAKTFNQRSDYKYLNTPNVPTGTPAVSRAFNFNYYVDPGNRNGMPIQFPIDLIEEGPHTLPGTNLQIMGWDPAGATNAAFANRSITKSGAIAWQGFLLKGNAILSWGKRRDNVEAFDIGGSKTRDLLVIEDDPLWTRITGKSPETDMKSIILRSPWRIAPVSAFYAKSSSQQIPSFIRKDFDGSVAQTGSGKGEEFGIALTPFGDRLGIRISRYENIGTGNVSNLRVLSPLPSPGGNYGQFVRHNTIDLEYNAMIRMIARGQDPYVEKYRAFQQAILENTPPGQRPANQGATTDVFDFLSDTRSIGYELTVVGNLTRAWRLSISAAKSDARETNIGKNYLEFIKERIPVWIDQNTNPSNPSYYGNQAVYWPIGTRITAIEAVRASIVNYDWVYRQEGRSIINERKYRFNITSRYGFSEGRFKGLFVGLNYNWQSPVVIGYRWTTPDTPNAFSIPGVLETPSPLGPDLDQAIKGSPLVTLDGFGGYGRRLFNNKVQWRIQVNVRNVINNTELIAQRADPDGNIVVANAKAPRAIILTNSFEF